MSATVAQIREQYGFTQEALARHLGVTFSTVNAWEAGRSNPQPRHRARLRQLLMNESQSPDHLNILISDTVTRRRTATVRALTLASEALNQTVTVHDEPHEVDALIAIGALKPDIVIFGASRTLVSAREVAARLSQIRTIETSILLLCDDDVAHATATPLTGRVEVLYEPLTLAKAGELLRLAVGKKLVEQA